MTPLFLVEILPIYSSNDIIIRSIHLFHLLPFMSLWCIIVPVRNRCPLTYVSNALRRPQTLGSRDGLTCFYTSRAQRWHVGAGCQDILRHIGGLSPRNGAMLMVCFYCSRPSTLAAVAAAATQTDWEGAWGRVLNLHQLPSQPRGTRTWLCVQFTALESRVADSSLGQCRAFWHSLGTVFACSFVRWASSYLVWWIRALHLQTWNCIPVSVGGTCGPEPWGPDVVTSDGGKGESGTEEGQGTLQVQRPWGLGWFTLWFCVTRSKATRLIWSDTASHSCAGLSSSSRTIWDEIVAILWNFSFNF